jgi:DNA-directed RNA polymerase subunit N (RpoN/RPB10)
MRPQRAERLADWLRRVADQEDGSAEVLDKLGHDAKPCRTKARLFNEIADHLSPLVPVIYPDPEAVETIQDAEGDIVPPDPKSPSTGLPRAPL